MEQFYIYPRVSLYFGGAEEKSEKKNDKGVDLVGGWGVWKNEMRYTAIRFIYYTK